MAALHFDLVFDLWLMVYIAEGLPVQRSKRAIWAVLPLFILSLTSFVMGWSTTFMSAQYCADIFLKYPPCQSAYLFIAVFDLLHAFVRCRDKCAFIVAAKSLADHPCFLLYTCALMYAASQAQVDAQGSPGSHNVRLECEIKSVSYLWPNSKWNFAFSTQG